MSGLNISESERTVLQRALEIVSSTRRDGRTDRRGEGVSRLGAEESVERGGRRLESGIVEAAEDQNGSTNSRVSNFRGGEHEGLRSSSRSSTPRTAEWTTPRATRSTPNGRGMW